MLTIIGVASLADLGIALFSIFLPIWTGIRGVLVHSTTLCAEIAILTITAIILRGELAADTSVSSNTTIAYFLVSGVSTCMGFMLSVFGIRQALQMARKILLMRRVCDGGCHFSGYEEHVWTEHEP